MKGRTYLLLDMPFVCHRNFYAMPALEHGGDPTAVIFGLMRDLVVWQDLFCSEHPIFCFDRGRSLRARKFAGYKSRRDQLTEEQRHVKQALRKQIHRLRHDYLRRLGYRNIFSQVGYEADDVIASVSSDIASQGGQCVIIGSDKDLYQLLSPRISIYNPLTKKLLTEERFIEKYGVPTLKWVEVKSICGCKTDSIPGIKGVGEKTALAFLSGRLKAGSRGYELIVKGNAIWERNRELVELPFPGTMRFTINEDKVTMRRWQRLMERLCIRNVDVPIIDKGFRRRAIRRRKQHEPRG